jgi:TolB-like protein
MGMMDDSRNLAEQLRLTLGDTFVIERELGGGGMSRVFVAEERSLGRRVALKVVTAELGDDVNGERFRREIQLVATLQHPHVVPLYSAGVAGDAVYYTMPFVEGESLRARLQREGRLPIADALRIGREIADALDSAHRRGIIHRDIKPENVLLSGGHAVVADFGVAKALGAATGGGSGLTSVGVALGTPAYMAPEQVSADAAADHRVDIYALGCVMYEMLAGRAPFTGTSIADVMKAQVMQAPEALSQWRPEVPVDVAAWVAKALAKSPDQRWATAADARAGLDDSLARISASHAPQAGTVSRRWVAIAAGALVLVAAGAYGFLRERPFVDPAAATIAVLPFVPTNPGDTALARLGRDLVVTVSANLDSVGNIRVIDALTTLAQTMNAGAFSLHDGLALGKKLGAKSVVYGSLVRAGNNVRLDFNLVPTDSAAAVARGPVPASADVPIAFTDRTTWAILNQVWRRGGAPTPSVVDVTTRSIPALKAFLEGENFILQDRWEAAEQAFTRAIAADSSFWFAYWRAIYAQTWQLRTPDSLLQARVSEHHEKLPQRERILFNAVSTPGVANQLDSLQRLMTAYPDFWMAGFRYADLLVHSGYYLGLGTAEGSKALERVRALNPNLLPLYDHLFLANIGFDSATSMANFAELMRRDGFRGWTEMGIDGNEFGRLAALGNFAAPSDTVVPDSVVRSIASWKPRGPVRVLGDVYYLWAGLGAQQEILTNRLRTEPIDPDRLKSLDEIAATTKGMRGNWRQSLESGWRYARNSRSAASIQDAWFRTALGVWIGALAPDSARRYRADAPSSPPEDADRRLHGITMRFVDGVVAVAAGDADSVRVVLRELSTDTSRRAKSFARLLVSLDHGRLGQERAAIDSLVALQDDINRGRAGGHPFVSIASRMAAGPLMAKLGAYDGADRQLRFYESQISNMRTWRISMTVAPLAALERARAAEKSGRADEALADVNFFLRRFDAPDPPLKPLLDEGRVMKARLTAGTDRPKTRALPKG